MGNRESVEYDSHADGLLEYPQYTRPAVFRGAAVPQLLQEGNHARIARWRRWHALRLTRERRPDLYARLELSAADRKLLICGNGGSASWCSVASLFLGWMTKRVRVRCSMPSSQRRTTASG